MRTKITLILAAVMAIYSGFHLFIQFVVIVPRFQQLERDDAIRNMNRCIAALEREIQLLDRFTFDWSAWDAMYQFVQDNNAQFKEENLVRETFESNRIHAIQIIDNNRKVVWGRYMNPSNGAILHSDLFPPDIWPADHPLLGHKSPLETYQGVMVDGARIFLLSSRPIIKSNNRGPIMGTLVMARQLDHDWLSRLSAQTLVNLRIWSLAGETIPDREWAMRQQKNSSPFMIREADKRRLHIFSIYPNIKGEPALMIRAELPREITGKTRRGLQVAFVSVLVMGMLMLLVLYILLRQTVVKPLISLAREAEQAGPRGIVPDESMLVRKDELGQLARGFKQLMEELAEDKRQMARRSYHTGKAEVASSLMHNIRNGLHPIAAFTDLMLQDLREAPLRDLKTVLSELRQDRLDPERRKQLREFRDLSVTELITLCEEMEQSLRKTLTQTKKVIQIASSHKQRRNIPEMEPVHLADVLTDASKELPEDDGVVVVRTHPSVHACPPVTTNRIQLQQVLTNLLIFAPIPSPEHHTVEIRLSPEHLSSKEQISLEIIHSRISLESKELERLFERGYTECRTIPDQGLHWCANTVNALGGRLRAHQEFGGTTFQLVLPVQLSGPGEAT